MELIAGATIIRSIGLDLTFKCMDVLASSTRGVYNLLSNLHSSSSSEVKSFLRELDMTNDILILESLLKEIDIEKRHTKTLALCLEGLKDCVSNIEKTIVEMHERSIYNNSLWFGKSFRTYGFTDIMESLKFQKSILDNRKKTLFEILKINNYLNPFNDVSQECDISIIEPL